jgi:hypothetical protein
MNIVFFPKIRDRRTIACEVTIEHELTEVSRRPASQQFVELLLPSTFDERAAGIDAQARKLFVHALRELLILKREYAISLVQNKAQACE